jgi:hypothetical protein
VWALWVLSGLTVWIVLAVAVAVVVGRGVRLGDRRSAGMAPSGTLTTADLPAALRAG